MLGWYFSVQMFFFEYHCMAYICFSCQCCHMLPVTKAIFCVTFLVFFQQFTFYSFCQSPSLSIQLLFGFPYLLIIAVFLFKFIYRLPYLLQFKKFCWVEFLLSTAVNCFTTFERTITRSMANRIWQL